MRSKLRQPYLRIFLLLCFLAAETLAQVNTEKLRQSAWQAGWSSSVGFQLAFRKGNVEKNDYQLDGTLGWKQGNHLVFGKIMGEFEDIGGNQISNAAFVHLRYNLQLETLITPEIFTQYQFDKSLKLNSRFLIGSGIRVEGQISPKIFMAFGSGYMWEQEFYEQGLSLTTPRWTNYLVTRWRPRSNWGFSNTIYYQPAFDDFGFFRVLDEGGLRVDLSDHIVLRVDFNYRYDSDPLYVELKKYDVRLTNGLELHF